ncbi:FMP32, mitochondrial-like protein [Tanacetum coccineum]|uniref:FMP32, mitochondrial-like protein n=1 Tax=Tanacetum coccineum TaxID=301880 RepID=A0ABQ5B0C4_9ASTR
MYNKSCTSLSSASSDRRLEGQGVPSKQAEAITSAISEVLNDSLENVAQSFVSNDEMQRIKMTQDGNLGKLKSQVQRI